jgi:hypothetical protein
LRSRGALELPLSGHRAHGLTCCRLDPVANDPTRTSTILKTYWLSTSRSLPKAEQPIMMTLVELEWRSDMRQQLGHLLDCNCLGRRNFLKMAGGATVAGITGGSFFLADRARADALSKELRDKLTPEQIIQAMKNGNKRFRRGERKERNYLREQKASAKGQYPAAVLLTCMDARAPAEVIMDLGIGDIFNCRLQATSRTRTSSAAWSMPANWQEPR